MVCTCMYIYIHICIYMYLYVFMCIHIHICTRTYIYIYVYIYTHGSKYIHARVYNTIQMHWQDNMAGNAVSMSMAQRVHSYIDTYIYIIYIYICIHIQYIATARQYGGRYSVLYICAYTVC